jgi:hypothetical protein
MRGVIRRITVKAGPGKNYETLSEKQLKAKKARGVAQVVEDLTSRHKALSSSPSTAKRKKKKKSFIGFPCAFSYFNFSNKSMIFNY